jgi:hypothetical protein
MKTAYGVLNEKQKPVEGVTVIGFTTEEEVCSFEQASKTKSGHIDWKNFPGFLMVSTKNRIGAEVPLYPHPGTISPNPAKRDLRMNEALKALSERLGPVRSNGFRSLITAV